MKFKQIIETAIERGKWEVPEYVEIDIESGVVAFINKDGFSKKSACINLENIENLKELCRVLFSEKYIEHPHMPWLLHFQNLIYLNSWAERKEYIIKNFK